MVSNPALADRRHKAQMPDKNVVSEAKVRPDSSRPKGDEPRGVTRSGRSLRQPDESDLTSSGKPIWTYLKVTGSDG